MNIDEFMKHSSEHYRWQWKQDRRDMNVSCFQCIQVQVSMWQVGSSNSNYIDVLQHCIVTKITSVKMEEHVTKMSIINTRANVSLALAEDTVK